MPIEKVNSWKIFQINEDRNQLFLVLKDKAGCIVFYVNTISHFL